MRLQIFHIAYIVAGFQALLMAVFLFTGKKGNRQSNIILGFWFLCFAALIASTFSVSHGIWQYFIDYHKPIFLVSLLSLLIGPLFYFYTRILLDEKFHFKKKDLIHLLPMIIAICCTMGRYIYIRDFIIWKSLPSRSLNGFFLVQNLFYNLLVLKLLKLHKFTIKTFFSYKRDLKYDWIRFLIIGSFFIWIAKLQLNISSFLVPLCAKSHFYRAAAYAMAFFLVFTSIVYVSLRKPLLFLSKRKYMNSKLLKKDKQKIKYQLLKYMNDKKLYLDPNLSLDILANNLSITRERLSQIINETFHQNFYDFVNQYRVKECIRHLKKKNESKKTILRIAFESGFNTKATFNSAFKKFTGKTPKEFIKSLDLNTNFN